MKAENNMHFFVDAGLNKTVSVAKFLMIILLSLFFSCDERGDIKEAQQQEIKDSIKAATVMQDSLAAIETSMLPDSVSSPEEEEYQPEPQFARDKSSDEEYNASEIERKNFNKDQWAKLRKDLD